MKTPLLDPRATVYQMQEMLAKNDANDHGNKFLLVAGVLVDGCQYWHVFLW